MTTTTPQTTAQPPPPPVAPAAPVPPPVPPPPISPASVPVAASRRSVLTLAAAMGLLATAGLLYVLVDRPGLREPLEAVATIGSAVFTAAGVVWGVSRASR
ncbi:hypothetical protein [Streptomyces microflavus]|uniref:hypothetical protein n=1 Tax=Streptomyces microflavus TaxID=1919 RepID=UPI003653ADEA